MSAFDFAFGLRGWGVTEGDAVEVEVLAQLGQSIGLLSKEQAVVIDVDFQGQSVLSESGGEQMAVRQEVFVLIDSGAHEKSAAIIEHVEHRKGLGTLTKPAMRRGVQLPQFANLAALPPSHSGGQAATWPRVSELVFDGPATNLRSVDFELVETKDFAGGKAVGSWRFTA